MLLYVGPLRLSQQNTRYPFFYVVPEARRGARWRSLEGNHVSSKCPSRIQGRDEGVGGRNKIVIHSPGLKGCWFALQANQRLKIYHKTSWLKKMEVVARPAAALGAAASVASLRKHLTFHQQLLALGWKSFGHLLCSGGGGWNVLPHSRHCLAAWDQVWSLPQFYSVDFSRSRIGVKSAFSTNTQSRFVSVVLHCVLGPLHLARHTWRCPRISVVPEATLEVSWGALKGAVSAQKAPQWSEMETRELLVGTEEKSISPIRGN